MTAGLHALVVDDEQPVLDELVWLLGRDDRVATVRATRSGTEALMILEQGGVDVVFLDVAMPGMSGPDLQRELMLRRKEIPIIFITAHGGETVRPQLLEQGAVECLFKPFSDTALREALNTALRTS